MSTHRMSLPPPTGQRRPLARYTEGHVSSPSIAPVPVVSTGIPDLPGLDRSQVDDFFSGDREFFLSVLGGFVADYGDSVVRIEEALRQEDSATATKILHKLRGSVGYLGAVQLAELASALEVAIKGKSAEVPRLLAEFDAVHGALVRAATPYLNA